MFNPAVKLQNLFPENGNNTPHVCVQLEGSMRTIIMEKPEQSVILQLDNILSNPRLAVLLIVSPEKLALFLFVSFVRWSSHCRGGSARSSGPHNLHISDRLRVSFSRFDEKYRFRPHWIVPGWGRGGGLERGPYKRLPDSHIVTLFSSTMRALLLIALFVVSTSATFDLIGKIVLIRNCCFNISIIQLNCWAV